MEETGIARTIDTRRFSGPESLLVLISCLFRHLSYYCNFLTLSIIKYLHELKKGNGTHKSRVVDLPNHAWLRSHIHQAATARWRRDRIPRARIGDEAATPWYHCISSCVRPALLNIQSCIGLA